MAETSTLHHTLFRRESLQARAYAWQGRPSLVLASPATFTTIAAVTLALAFAALIVFGGYARRVDLQGTVLPSAGLVAIAAPASGHIEALAVEDGTAVAQGTPLYTLGVDTETKNGALQRVVADVLRSERNVLSAQIDRTSATAEQTENYLNEKMTNLRAQIEQLDWRITTSAAFHQTLETEYRLFLEMLKNRQAPRNEFDNRQQAWMRSKTELQTLDGSRLRLSSELNDAEHQLATARNDSSNQIDSLKAKIAEIDEKLAAGAAHGSIVIRAPRSGIVTDIVGKPGQVVKTGSPLLTIVPSEAHMQAVLRAPSSAMGFIHAGQRVLLRYSAFPYQKFGEHAGTVVSIARAAIAADEASRPTGSSTADKESGPYYRVVVELDAQFVDVDGRRHALPAEMRVEAYALLDRRPLYQWILQPVYAFGRAAHQN